MCPLLMSSAPAPKKMFKLASYSAGTPSNCKVFRGIVIDICPDMFSFLSIEALSSQMRA
jgi:hypothetical protein